MLPPDNPFNWRAFWADLLRGSGRALLTLDGSDAAQAAMSGLDSFDAAQTRRAEQGQTPREEDPNDPSSVNHAEFAREPAGAVRVAPTWRRADPPNIARYPGATPSPSHSEAHVAPNPHWAFSWLSGAPTPRIKPMPMSANPYDFDGLPVQVSFPPVLLPALRRR